MVEVIVAAVVAIVIGFLIGYFLMQKMLQQRNADAAHEAETTLAEAKREAESLTRSSC